MKEVLNHKFTTISHLGQTIGIQLRPDDDAHCSLESILLNTIYDVEHVPKSMTPNFQIVLKYSAITQGKQENEDSTSICAQGVGIQ